MTRAIPTPVRQAVLLLCATAFAGQGSVAFALPQGGTVTAGSATINSSGSVVRIQQASQRAITNWKSFDTAKGEKVLVEQPNSSAALLARVIGGLGPSSLGGILQANGKFFLINPQGVIVGRDAVVDTGAFVATSLDVLDREFMAGGPLRFQGAGDGDIVNLGQIRASNGSVTLVGRSVRNLGSIAAPQGSATLAGGTEYLMSSPDQPGVLVKGVASAVGGTGVDNQGLVEAASVKMQAAGGNLYALAINQAGVARATGTAVMDGRVVLTADTGTVDVSGSVTARNANGSGGGIHVGGGARGRDAAIPNASETRIGASAVLDASAGTAQGDGGKVTVWADNATVLNGRVRADAGTSGGNGGFVEVSGRRSLVFKPVVPVSASAPNGKAGTLLLDPDGWEIGSVDGVNKTSAATLQAQLAAMDVVIDSSTNAGNIDFNSSVAWSSGRTLTARSGNNINVNADIDGGTTGTVKLYSGLQGADMFQVGPLTDGLTNVAAGATIKAGKLTVGGNTQWAIPDYVTSGKPGAVTVNGKLDTGTLELDLNGGAVSIAATNPANRIGSLQSTALQAGALGQVDVASGSGPMDVTLAATADSVQVASAGNLTLASGTALDLSAGGKAVFASTGGNVVNDAGAGAIGGAGSFLIYSGTTAGTVKGGLSGTDEFSRSFAGNPPGTYTDGASRFLFRNPGPSLPQLTYRADDKTRFYGDANPALTYSISDGSGPVVEASLTGQVSGAPLLSTSAVQTSAAQNYIIAITQGTLSSLAYDFNFVNGQLRVNPAPLTIAVQPASRFYGDANPAFTTSVTGLKNLDTAASIQAGIAAGTLADAQSNAGAYPIAIALSAPANPNYAYTLTPSTLTVNPAPVVISLPALSRTYGDANPDFLAQASATGLKNLDDLASAFPALALGTGATAASPVGSYAVNASGLTNGNYAVTTSLQPLGVTPAALLVAIDSKTRVFGDANPAFTYAVSGLVNNDTAPAFTVGTTATNLSPFGTYAITGSGSLANYAVGFTNGTLTISKRPVTLTAGSASRLYGDANPALSVSQSGLLAADQAYLSYWRATTGATQASNVGTYATTVSENPATAALASSFISLPSYDIQFAPGTLTINKAPLTLAANSISAAWGDRRPALTYTVNGLRLGQSASVLTGVVLTTAPDSVSPGGAIISPIQNLLAPTPTVGAYPITFVSTGTAQNYAVTSASNATYTVTKRPYVVKVGDASVYSDVLAGTTFSATAPGAYANGPAIPIEVVSNAPTGATSGQYTLTARLASSVSPSQRAAINNSYILDLSDTGVLTVIPAMVPLTVPPDFALSARPTPPPAEAPLVVSSASTIKPYGAQDAVVLLRQNQADLAAQLQLFIFGSKPGGGYTPAFSQLSKEDRETLLALSTGKTSWDSVAGQFASNDALRSALAPVLAMYALSLMDKDGKLNDSQYRLLTSIGAKFNEQREQMIAAVETKYSQWQKAQSTPNMTAMFGQNLPDLVGAERQRLANGTGLSPNAVLGITAAAAAVGGAAAGTAVGVAVGTVAATIIPMHQVAVAAASAGGPIGIAVAAVIVVGSVALEQTIEGNQNAKEYSDLMKTKGQAIDIQSLDLAQKSVKTDAVNAIMGVFGGFL